MKEQTIELLGRRVQVVDLSRPLGPTASEPTPPRINHISHQEGAQLWEWMYGIPPTALPQGLGLAGELVELSTHAGTHLDAPWHYAPTSGGEPAWTIDQVPLQWFVGRAVVLDVSDLPDGCLVSDQELEKRLHALEYQLLPGDIVLLHTGADATWGTAAFFETGCGLGREAVLYLVDQGVRVIGTDAWSLDRPYPLIGREWESLQDPTRLWPAHFAGIERRYCQIEKLTNLLALPHTGSTILCFPIKVEGGSGAWARVVGLIPQDL